MLSLGRKEQEARTDYCPGFLCVASIGAGLLIR
jgi:hypothetical protein